MTDQRIQEMHQELHKWIEGAHSGEFCPECTQYRAKHFGRIDSVEPVLVHCKFCKEANRS